MQTQEECEGAPSFSPVPEEAVAAGGQDGEEEGDVADGDHDEGEHVGALVTVVPGSGGGVLRAGAVHVNGPHDQPDLMRAKDTKMTISVRTVQFDKFISFFSWRTVLKMDAMES